MMWSGSWGGWDFVWMPLLMIAFWGGVVWAVTYLVGRFSAPRSAGGEKSAIDLLEQRFARGEIDEDEFQARRRILDSRVA